MASDVPEPSLPWYSPSTPRAGTWEPAQLQADPGDSSDDDLEAWVRLERRRRLASPGPDADQPVPASRGQRDPVGAAEDTAVDAVVDVVVDELELGEDAVELLGLSPCPLNT